jgi:hypothetical protein
LLGVFTPTQQAWGNTCSFPFFMSWTLVEQHSGEIVWSLKTLLQFEVLTIQGSHEGRKLHFGHHMKITIKEGDGGELQ